MTRLRLLKAMALGSAGAAILATGAQADQFNIPSGDLATALSAFMAQTGVELVVAANGINQARTRGVKGDLSADVALSRILAGTGFVQQRDGGAVAIVRASGLHHSEAPPDRLTQLADAVTPAHAAAASVETVVVTSSKIKGDIQTVPIAITALSQEQLTSRQIAGGPDLVKEVPNLTFSKTNFTGYNVEIRGIGTQAISVATDPAVAVAFNDIPFIRNHFFEQEFYDVGQVEVLRGPQGTLYGRNATAGVVNVISAKPTDQFETMLSADWGNYTNRRYEGMVNIPVVDDRLDIRVAGEWTKRDGYSFNELTGKPIDGRDLWSSRVSIGWKPFENVQTTLVWEHFQEDDDRMRTAKQLCKTDPGLSTIDGYTVANAAPRYQTDTWFSQGCLPGSLYAASSFEVPNGFSLPYYGPLAQASAPIFADVDPYASTTQSRNLRDIESTINPVYKAKNNVVEFNADYTISPTVTLTSQTGYSQDFLFSTEDYNRFNTAPGVFRAGGNPTLDERYNSLITPDGYFCDPQLGCSNRLVAMDRSDEHAWQLSQEFRAQSHFAGPFNFSVGGNYLHYETEENYFVFINTVTLFAAYPIFGTKIVGLPPWQAGITDNHECLQGGFQYQNPDLGAGPASCVYIDPNPLGRLNKEGHNYFLSQNPYLLNSYALFGETYYDVTSNVKLTAGLRWTDDKKRFLYIPSQLLVQGYGYGTTRVVDQQWNQLTGRLNATWSPKTNFTDQTLIYGSYAHGYKAGGANPPGAVLLEDAAYQPVHPLTFKPEFIDAFELGTKNTLLDGALTFNSDVFYYNYKNYQISRIVDRTAINDNFNATVKGAEIESSWEPLPGLKFNFAGGWEDTAIAKGSKSVDLMDRTAGTPGWMVLKPEPEMASNCVVPTYYVVARLFQQGNPDLQFMCGDTYVGTLGQAGNTVDFITGLPYVANPTVGINGPIPAGYPGFDPASAPNGGAGFDKDLSGNELPNAPHFTTSLSAEYTLPVSEDWAATLHSDFYWQSQSWARVFNDRPYDKIRGYSNVNLALILTSASGWQVMGYLKNVFDTTAITGDFLNSDDTGLTTNMFLTDPRLFGVRVTKNW
jgi:iron complex outermembrane receptor protein